MSVAGMAATVGSGCIAASHECAGYLLTNSCVIPKQFRPLVKPSHFSRRTGWSIVSQPVLGAHRGSLTPLKRQCKAADRLPAVADVNVAYTAQDNEEAAQFCWERAWYPVSLIEDLKPDVPTPFTLLGLSIVIWRDKEGSWRAFEDKCPHRLAPLSEGRVDPDTGNLQCSYHGWAFQGDGSCSHIPQLQGDQARLADSPKACAVSLPTKVHQKMLWVWPDAATRIESTLVEPVTEPLLDDTSFVSGTIQRDLEYGFDTLLENVSDPSHVPFAHHGYQGNREKAAPIPINVISNTLSGWKAVCPGVTSTSGHPATWELRFQPPCLLTFDFTMRPAPKGRKAEERAAKGQPPPAQRIGLVAYCVPISPGRCRLIFHSPRNFLTNINPPRWYLHMVNNAILDGDSIFLHMQERYLRQDAQGRDSPAEAGKFLEKCYMPASSDAALIEGRKWLKRFGGGGPKWLRGKDELPPLLSRELALDRYKQHVLLCSSCSGALRNVRVLQRVLAAAAGLQVVAAALTSAISQRLSMLWAASAIAFATIAWLLKEKMEPSFLFKDYVHAHR